MKEAPKSEVTSAQDRNPDPRAYSPCLPLSVAPLAKGVGRVLTAGSVQPPPGSLLGLRVQPIGSERVKRPPSSSLAAAFTPRWAWRKLSVSQS